MKLLKWIKERFTAKTPQQKQEAKVLLRADAPKRGAIRRKCKSCGRKQAYQKTRLVMGQTLYNCKFCGGGMVRPY